MKKLLFLLLLAVTAAAQPITLTKNPNSGAAPNALTSTSKVIVVPDGGSFTASGTGVIIATGGSATTVPWSGVTGTPTTLTGYGVTNTLSTTAPLTGGGALASNLTLAMPAATGSANGYLTSADWMTFNAKQPAGAYITALTGDVTAAGPGSATATLAIVASAGTTGSSTAIPVITIDAKGRTTSISTAAVIAPAGTLTGATLASNVLASSLTSVGTLTGGATGAGFTVALGSSTITGVLLGTNGGTGVANTGKTITLGGNLATSGAFSSTFTMTNTTAVTFPTSGTLATTTGTIANATNIGITDDVATNATVYPTWVAATTGFNPAKVSSTQLSFNPSTGLLTSTSGFIGSISLSGGLIDFANTIRSVAGQQLLLGTGTFGTALQFASATGNATFTATVTAPSYTLNGTGGAGFIDLTAQVAPSAPASGHIRIFDDVTNKFAWIGASGNVRTFDGTLTASRAYTLPDADSKIPVFSQTITFSGPTAARTVTFPDSNFTAARTDAAQTFSGTQAFGVLTATSVTNSGLTSGRVPFASTGGLMADAATLTFNSGTGALSATSFVGSGASLTSVVNSITGTAGNVTASAATGAVTLSLPTALTSINSLTAVVGTDMTFTPGVAKELQAVFSGASHGLVTIATNNTGNQWSMRNASAPTTDIWWAYLNGANALVLNSSSLSAAYIFGASGTLSIAATTPSTVTTNGSLVNAGGFGNAGAGFFGGNVTAPNFVFNATTSVSASANKGALGVASGVVSMWSWGPDASTTGTFDFETRSSNGSLGSSAGTLGDSGLTIAAITNAVSSSSGSVVVGTGLATVKVGIGGGNIFAGGTINAGSTTEATTGGAGSLITAGGIYAAKKLITASTLSTADPTNGIGAWMLGTVRTGVALAPSTTSGLQVKVDGTLYTLAVLSTNP